MSVSLRQIIGRWTTRLLVPDRPEDADLHMELFRVAAKGNRHTLFVSVPLAVVLCLTSLEWIGPAAAISWTMLAIASTVLAYVVLAKIRESDVDREEYGWWTFLCLVSCLPAIIVWPSIVAIVWGEADFVYRAYLLIFLCGSFTAVMTIYGPALQLMMLCAAGYVPYLVIYTVHPIDSDATWFGLISQVLFAAMMIGIGYNKYSAAAAGVRQRLQNQKLVKELAVANQRAETARLRAEEANHAKTDFIAAMSHDLRTPLNSILGFSDLIRRGVHGPLAPASYAEYVDDIYSSGNHLLTLINDILDMAKIEAGKREFEEEDVDLGYLADEALDMISPLAAKADVQLIRNMPPHPIIRSDDRALRQILINLLSNAVKFTKPGGKVTIFVRDVTGGGIALGVEDTGIGIAPEDMKKVLTLYGQVRSEVTVEGRGTGLGLPIVRGLIEALGGTFHMESEPEKGTCVWGEFPAAQVVLPRAIA